MRAASFHLPVRQHDDLIAVADRAVAMCDDDATAATTADILVDLLLDYWVESGGRLIKHQKPRLDDKCPGEFYSAALPAPEVPTPLAYTLIVKSKTLRDLL